MGFEVAKMNARGTCRGGLLGLLAPFNVVLSGDDSSGDKGRSIGVEGGLGGLLELLE